MPEIIVTLLGEYSADVELGLDTTRGDGLNDLEGVGVGGGEHTNNN